MKLNNTIKKYLNKLRRNNEFNTRNKIIYLDKFINKYKNIIIFIRNWEIDDEIINDAFLEIDRNRKRNKFIILEIL